MKVYATYNIKGGVGKTSAAVNLAHLAALDGHNVLLWDLDPQGAATYMFRVRPKVKGGGRALVEGSRSLDDAIKASDFDGLDVVPADFRYRNLDVQLDDMKRPTRRIRELLRPLRQVSTTSSFSTARRASRCCRRTSCTPSTRCWCR